MRLSDKMPQRKIRRTPDVAVRRETSRKPHREHDKETEVKLRVADRQALLGRLARLRARYHGRVHEMNTLYDTPDGALARRGRLLRIRVERPAEQRAGRTPNLAKMPSARRDRQGALLTFKGPVRGKEQGRAGGGRRYKIREEREVRVADGNALARIFEALGLRPSFRYEKYRSTYRLPHLDGVTLELDETPIGDFLEAEGTRAAIDRAAALLGYQPADYITKSYGQLFLDRVRMMGRASPSKTRRIAHVGARDMLFGREK
jgi:adenylate cyclase class IV